MLKFISVAALLALSACGGTYEQISEYPPTPDPKAALRSCLYQTMVLTPIGGGLVGALAMHSQRQQMTADCMAAHGWVLSE